VADLRLLCDELTSEAAAVRTEAASTRTEALSAREQVASQAEEMRQRQLELGQVTGERDQFQSQATEAVSQAEALRGQLAEGTERLAEATARAGTLAEGLAVAVGSAWSTRVVASQQRAWAEGMFCLLCDFVFVFILLLCLKNIVRLSSGFETALNESVKNCKTLAQAAEQKEVDRVAMFEAISAFYRTFGLGDVPSSSSPQSRLRALGGHVRSRLRGALHHGVRRAFAVLASHYDVDLERVSEGYCLLDEKETALSEVQSLTRLPRAQARRWLPSSRWRSFRLRRRPRPGQIPPWVETTLRVLLLPLLTPEPVGNSLF
jgi:hypothetical protein